MKLWFNNNRMVVFQELILYHTIPTFNDPEQEAFRIHCGKTSILSFSHNVSFPSLNNNFSFTFIFSSVTAFNLDQSRSLSFGKELSWSTLNTSCSNPESLLIKHTFDHVTFPKIFSEYWHEIKKKNKLKTLYHTIPTVNENEGFWKHSGKRRKCQHFLLFPQCFLPYRRGKSSFHYHLSCHLQMLWIWTSPKFCCCKELTLSQNKPWFFTCLQ